VSLVEQKDRPRRTTVYLRGALTGPDDLEQAKAGVSLGFNGEAATVLELGEDAHVYVDQGGALIIDTVPLAGPFGGYGRRQTYPSWRIIEIEEVGIK
jgi:hypothetical protein